MDFEDVKVYAASPWYFAQAGSIRDLHIEKKNRGNIAIISIFIGPKSDYCFAVSLIPHWELTDMTLAGDDANTIFGT